MDETAADSSFDEPMPIGRFPKSNIRYFPQNVLSAYQELHDLRERMYAAHLVAMQECPLFPPSISEPEVYRLLYMPTFEGPIVVRLNQLRDACHWQVVEKRCDGEGGFAPGNLVSETTHVFTPANFQTFSSLLEAAQYWNLPTFEESDGLDGSQVLLEGIRNGKYHIVDRWSPHETPYAKLALFMLRFQQSWAKRIYGWWSDGDAL
jgi:hypothetical protein